MNRNKPISQVEIENELLRLMEMLEKETEEFEVLCIDLAKKESMYKLDWAKAYLSAKGPIKERETWSTYTLGEQLQDYMIAEGLVKAKREKLLSLRTSIDSLRTLNANVRVQV